MKNLTFLAISLLFLSILALFAIFWHLAGPGGHGIVGEITVDSRRYAVTQRWSLEGHRVGFVYELEDGTWVWCYINHQEDARWWSAQLVYDEMKDTIDIYKSGTLRARLDRRASTFELIEYFEGSPKGIVPAPQSAGAPPPP